MKTRLTLFSLLILLLPPCALMLSDQDWPSNLPITGSVTPAALLCLITLLIFTLGLDRLSWLKTGHSLFRSQPQYARALVLSGSALGVLFSYLNFFSASWVSPLSLLNELLLTALFGAVLLPAILIARLWLANLPGLLRLCTHLAALPASKPEIISSLLFVTSVGGLMGGIIWPAALAGLFWLSPLMLLISMQLLWNESHVLSGTASGDWSRLLLGSLSGVLVCVCTLLLYRVAGGALQLNMPDSLILLNFAGYGLTCLQLGDLLAENWRGKQRIDVLKKKPFPIPVVVKK